MAYSVTITYTPANDILNAKVAEGGVVTPAPIAYAPKTAPSDAYIYAPAGSTTPVYNQETIITTDADGKAVAANAYATAAYNTSGQKRWPKGSNSIIAILEAYATPQIPVYRAWQTFKLAIEGGSTAFEVATFAESEFYREAGKALTNYGITVVTAEVTEDGGEG